jgi:hypothetical protein
LVGGEGQDHFILGDANQAFYNDGDGTTAGLGDYAIIRDFNRFEDTLELHGSAEDYVVGDVTGEMIPTYAEVPASGLFLDSNGNGSYDASDELVAVMEHLSTGSLVLDASYIEYSGTPTAPPWHPTSDSNWELVFSDEFDGNALDANKWHTRYTNHNHYGGRTNPWNHEDQYYVGDDEVIDGVTYDAFEFENGVLKIVGQEAAQPITAAIEDPLEGHEAIKTFNYTSGILNGQNKAAFTYGYMEMRAKVPAGQGLWPAFWMMPTDGTWPPEIDIMETLGHRMDTVFTSFHYQDGGTVSHDQGEQTFTGT